MKDHSAMNTRAFVLVLSALASAALASAPSRTGAWERWGITKLTPEAAERRLLAAYDLLYADKYDSARQAYAALVRDYPRSAEAHQGLSIASRYSEKRDSAWLEAKTAMTLDPDAVGILCNYHDLMSSSVKVESGGPAMDESTLSATRIGIALKATRAKHRYATYAHVGLWIDYMVAGRLTDARREMKFLYDKGYFPPALLDFARNLMSATKPDAILFTNGDNDTEPLWCLQAGEGFRPDVAVVNLALLVVPKVTAMMRDSLRLPVSFSTQELEQLKSAPDSAIGKPTNASARLVDNIIANCLKQNRPVYFASTVSPEGMGSWKDHTVGEGLVRRVVSSKADTNDVTRMAENVKAWRFSSVGRKTEWLDNMSPMLRHVDEMNIAYVPPCVDLAQYYYSHGDTAQGEQMFHKAFSLVQPWDSGQRIAQLVRMWLNLNPNSAEAKELSKKYD